MFLYVEDKNQSLMIHLEHQEQYQENMKCIPFLDQLCRRYGSTYEGRRQAACSFLHIRQKAPIVVNETTVLFPTLSQEDPMCIWINYCLVKGVEDCLHQTKFIFTDDTEIYVDMDYRSAMKQLRRCSHYLYALNLHHNTSMFIKNKRIS